LCLVLNRQNIKSSNVEAVMCLMCTKMKDEIKKLSVVQNDSHCSWIRPYSLCYGLTV
jgi:hypothetical protein